MDNQKQLGKKIKDLRNSLYMSQNQLAKQLGVTDSSIGMYELGEREPSLEIIEKIARFFGVSFDYLLDSDSEDSVQIIRGSNVQTSRVIEVIRTSSLFGDGTKENPVREIIQYWSLEGKLLATHDGSEVDVSKY